MDLSVAIVSGALFGLLGCVAPAALFERALRGSAGVSLAAGMAAVRGLSGHEQALLGVWRGHGRLVSALLER